MRNVTLPSPTLRGRIIRSFSYCLLFTLLIFATLPLPTPAQETHSDNLLTVAHYLDFERAGSLQISPDGSTLAFVMLVPEKENWSISIPNPPEESKWMPHGKHEYHGTGSKPSNFMRTQLYIMDWFERYPEPVERISHPVDNSVLMVDVFARFYYSPSTTDPLPALTPSDD